MMSKKEQKNVPSTEENDSYQSAFSNFLKQIGKKWQQVWEENKCYEADPDPNKPKFFCTFPYPYVNGSVHLGHGYSLMKVDVHARYMRMKGYNVLFPQGFHATGEPIAGMAKRLREGDPAQIKVLKAFGVPDEDIPKFYDPYHIVRYFLKLMEKDLRDIGVAVDWRRKFVTTTLTPVYSKFIEWQYWTLREKGYVTTGTHPVIWCPRDQSPTGDHDRLKGEGVSIAEFILLKFPYEDAYLVPATLRPETVYGVTNMYLHPDSEYVKIQINEEKWIVSKRALPKFQDQFKELKVLETIDPKTMFGRYTKNPVTGKDVIILPATFIDPAGGSGVVMSVPAHAPVDWVAIKQLQKNPESLEHFGVTKEQVMAIKPISLIEIEGYGEFPAVEAIEKEGIEDQNDPRIKDITRQIYKKEFHQGKCKPIMGKKFAGKIVKTVKEEIIKELMDQNKAAILYEPEDLVVCRCGTRCHVKILENQWFLKFSDPQWKQRVREHLKTMNIHPENARTLFENTIEWLEDKACARKSGLGTPLPWDPEWIVETLSDSTIYMAYYTIAHYVNQGLLTEDQATKELFDYIFLGKGDIEELTRQLNLDQDLIKRMRDEFTYWYPLDLRGSGKDLIQNHLTFCLFHHIAVFEDPQLAPRTFNVNGYMAFQGQKMSKSKGILTPLSTAVEIFGTDLARIGLIAAGEGLDDANFNVDDIRSYDRWLENFYKLTKERAQRRDVNRMDRWLRSRMQKHIQQAEKYMQSFLTRSYVQEVLFKTMNDIKWYRRRTATTGSAFEEAIDAILRMLIPVTPHLCEEIWKEQGRDGFAIDATFPEVNPKLIDEMIEKEEEYLHELMDDIENIKQALKLEKIKKLTLIIAAPWKYHVHEEAIKDRKNLIKRIMQNEELRKLGKMAANFAQNLMKSPTIPEIIPRERMTMLLMDAIDFLSNYYQCQVEIVKEEDIEKSQPRAKFATPARVAIVLE